MKINIKTDITHTHLTLIIVFIVLLTAFCQLNNFSLMIPMMLLFLGAHLFYLGKANPRILIQLGFLLTLIFAAAFALPNYFAVPQYYIPIASATMLTVLLFNDLDYVLLTAFASSVIVSLVSGWRLDMMLTFFVGSLTAAYTIKGARTRGQLMRAGLYVGIMQVICAILVNPDLHLVVTKAFALNVVRPLIINGFVSAFTVIATLKIFESLFGVLTNFSLLELSDFNQPLLKRMIIEAPGTYHHSLLVSNLAEAAADAVGANTLLTRVGAYYHDIGKMEKAEYFTENQLVGGNKHDRIEPSISRLVILKHVKEGIDLAKKYKLNPQIIDFIPQHHGTSLIYFFYQKALEEAEDEASVSEENFRYPGPKPQTKEAAIVLLADSVEGAIRSLDEPTPKKIEEVVRKIINNKFIDGQLDECTLTLKDIEKISLSFSRVLSAMYHSRVKYPEKKNASESSDQQSPKDGSDSPPSDNKAR